VCDIRKFAGINVEHETEVSSVFKSNAALYGREKSARHKN